jgi:hypothetical protein
MPRSPQANYKTIQRFLAEVDPREVLLRLWDEEAPFVLADPTEVPRRQARRTDYVGRLADGRTLGFWLLLARPYKGRALPCHFITYSEGTIKGEASSRNLEHRRALGALRGLLGGRPLVLDREFSYKGLSQAMEEEGVRYVVRLNLGGRPTISDQEGRRLTPSLRPGERRFYRGVLYKGRVRGNLAGEWRGGLREPLWLFTNLQPELALRVYRQRMKMEESFRDLKGWLGLGSVMNKKREQMEKMVALLLQAQALPLSSRTLILLLRQVWELWRRMVRGSVLSHY